MCYKNKLFVTNALVLKAILFLYVKKISLCMDTKCAILEGKLQNGLSSLLFVVQAALQATRGLHLSENSARGVD